MHDVLRSSGQPLDVATRRFMEPRFGHDFGRVRVHNDARAADSAMEVNARAYTVGQNIVFAANEFTPSTRRGRELLAHELAHTIQQRNASGSLRAGEPNGAFEANACHAAVEVMRGGGASGFLLAGRLQLQRAPASDDRWKNDVSAARYRGQLMASRLRKHGKLSREARAKINEELAYFEGEAKETYLREVRPILRAVVEIEMPADVVTSAASSAPADDAKPGQAEPESDYAAMAAYYQSTRQSQLDLAAATHAKWREQVHGMAAADIHAQWKYGHDDFVAVASSPGHGLKAEQVFQIWLRDWNDRWMAGRATAMRIAREEANKDYGAYYDKMIHFNSGDYPNAMGPEYAHAVAERDTAEAMFRQSVYVMEYLRGAEARGKSITLKEVNEVALIQDKITYAIREGGQYLAAVGAPSLFSPSAGRTLHPEGGAPIEELPASPPPEPTRPAAQTIKASPPPPPPRPPAKTIKSSPPPPPAAVRPRSGGGPAAATDAEVVQANVRNPASVKPSAAGPHQNKWQQLGGSSTAPPAFRDADGNIHIRDDHWLLGSPTREVIPPVSPRAGAPASPQTSAQGENIGTAKTQPPPPPAVAADPLAKTPPAPAPAPDPLAKTPAAPAPAAPVKQPEGAVAPDARTGAAAPQSQRPQAPRGQPSPPQSISADAVERIRQQPRPTGGRKGAGSNVNYTTDHQAHELAWRRFNGRGEAPAAFIYDGQVYLDPSRWPKGP